MPPHVPRLALQCPVKNPWVFCCEKCFRHCANNNNSNNNNNMGIPIWLVVEPYPSEKWWGSSVGMMTLPIWWESHKSHVPNRQPAMVYDTYNYNGGFEPTSNWGAPSCIVLLWFIVAIDYDLRCFTMMYCDLLWLGRIVIYYELIWI